MLGVLRVTKTEIHSLYGAYIQMREKGETYNKHINDIMLSGVKNFGENKPKWD